MSDRMKVKIVQSLTGAVVLTLLMQVFVLTGFTQYIWMLFLPLLMFFALGADLKKIPSMIICYACGIAWAYANGILQEVFRSFTSEIVVGIVPTIIIIFLILTIHEGFLAKTILGNIPCLFLGMATTFFVFMIGVPLTPLHLMGFFLYGIVLTVVLVFSGMTVCSAIFGKERAMKAIIGEFPGHEEDLK